ncbi:hypothetical protein VB636_22970, partial [Paracoccus sp. APAP_BH8]
PSGAGGADPVTEEAMTDRSKDKIVEGAPALLPDELRRALADLPDWRWRARASTSASASARCATRR